MVKTSNQVRRGSSKERSTNGGTLQDLRIIKDALVRGPTNRSRPFVESADSKKTEEALARLSRVPKLTK